MPEIIPPPHHERLLIKVIMAKQRPYHLTDLAHAILDSLLELLVFMVSAQRTA